MSLIALIVVVLILCLVWWAITQLAGAFGLPPQIVVVLKVLLVVIVVLWLLGQVAGVPSLRLT